MDERRILRSAVRDVERWIAALPPDSRLRAIFLRLRRLLSEAAGVRWLSTQRRAREPEKPAVSEDPLDDRSVRRK